MRRIQVGWWRNVCCLYFDFEQLLQINLHFWDGTTVNRQTKSVRHIRYSLNHYQVSCNLLRHLRSQLYYVQSFTYPTAVRIRAFFSMLLNGWRLALSQYSLSCGISIIDVEPRSPLFKRLSTLINIRSCGIGCWNVQTLMGEQHTFSKVNFIFKTQTSQIFYQLILNKSSLLVCFIEWAFSNNWHFHHNLYSVSAPLS